MSLKGITTITLLRSGKLVLSKSKNMNKASTTKDTRRKEIKRLGRKKEGMRDLVIQLIK